MMTTTANYRPKFSIPNHLLWSRAEHVMPLLLLLMIFGEKSPGLRAASLGARVAPKSCSSPREFAIQKRVARELA